MPYRQAFAAGARWQERNGELVEGETCSAMVGARGMAGAPRPQRSPATEQKVRDVVGITA